MRFTVCLVALTAYILCLTSLAQGEGPCRYKLRYESPCYDVLSVFHNNNKDERYELRKYGPTVWVKTQVEMAEPFWDDGASQPFRDLFRYISGNNDQGQKIDMTSPVLMSHTSDKVEMFFMLPAEFSDNPPTPTTAGVEIYTSPGGEFYVRSFGGWARFFRYNGYKTNLAELKNVLDSDNKEYDTELFFTAGYDSPYAIFNRLNEVWIPKK